MDGNDKDDKTPARHVSKNPFYVCLVYRFIRKPRYIGTPISKDYNTVSPDIEQVGFLYAFRHVHCIEDLYYFSLVHTSDISKGPPRYM